MCAASGIGPIITRFLVHQGALSGCRAWHSRCVAAVKDEDELAAENAFDDDLIDQVTFEREAFYARENPVKKSMAREIATNYSSHLFLFNAKLKDTYGSGVRCIDSLEQVSE